MPDLKTPIGFFVYVLSVLVFSSVARIGWEIGGWIWARL